jgi:hypothetical protein
MGASLSINAYSSKDNKEFQKHYKAVVFCLENGLSYPKETSEFFKGRIDGGDLEDYSKDYLLEKIENGVQVKIPMLRKEHGYEYHIKISDLPSEVDVIVCKLSY